MILPLRDDNSQREIVPWVNYALIVANVLVFLVGQRLGANDQFTYEFSLVPEAIRTGQNVGPVALQDPDTGKEVILPLKPTPLTPYLSLFTSMFLHGGLAHILGNMLFLWIFGDNIEDVLGHVRYLVFYLVCGVLSALAHVACVFAFHGNPYIPTLGASGAISGVLGAYLLLFPWNRVTVLLLRVVTDVPAVVAIGMWFLFQVIEGFGVLGGMQHGGVAYGAHIGGFLVGLALIKPFSFGPRWGA